MNNNPTLFRGFLLLLFAIVCCLPLKSAHLVGGDLSYTCLGNNQYTISLRMYRDCAGGGASFDNVARVAIYDTANNQVAQLNMFIGAVTSVSNRFQNDPCISVPANLCVEFTEYQDTITLPPIPGGYTLVHQRCCRNANIANIVNPSGWGNTYSINIPSMDTTCNSSVVFNGDIDLVSCVNFPTTIPLQFSEADGDSVSFEFCEIYHGGGQSGGGCNAVIPNPPCPPPFSPVSFQAPQTFSNPIPSNPVFTIDSANGTITGTPTQIGNYVLGICATEWRDGKIMSTTRLDYQLAVTNCIQNVISDMVTPQERPQILCNGFQVDFESESVNAQAVLWNFGDTASVADTSRSVIPSYNYPGPGNYKVTLIANPGLQCSDTTSAIFKVRPPVRPEFIIDGVKCLAANSLDFEPTGYYPSNSRFSWDFGSSALNPVFTGRSPQNIKWTSAGPKVVTMTVEWDSCSETIKDTIDIDQYTFFVDARPDTLEVTRGEEIRMNSSYGTSYYWYANEPAEFDNRFGRDVSAKLRKQNDTLTFYVLVTDENGCEGLDSVKVFVNPGDQKLANNIITPNGDGFNEYFDLSNNNPSGNCSFTVMNRWGAEVYTIDRYQNDWAGQNQDGNPLPDGTYYFVLQCGTKIQKTGPISVLRGF